MSVREPLKKAQHDAHRAGVGAAVNILNGAITEALAQLEQLERDHDAMEERLDDLQRCEALYRFRHDGLGASDPVVGGCWDRMRKAGDRARAILGTPGEDV